MKHKQAGYLWGLLILMIGAITSRATAADTLQTCYEATCRVSAGNGRGTGTVFEHSKGFVYVLTNAHVVGQNRTVQCEFWRYGHQSRPIQGEVLARVLNDTVDAACIALPETAFGGYVPTPIRMAPRNASPRTGDMVMSAGCAEAAWCTAWIGHVAGYSQDGDLHFRPAPANGRSGSAVCNAKGEIVGLLRARTIDATTGIACSLDNLYQQLTAAFQQPAQCGPNGCPVPPDSNGSNPYYLPYRRRQYEDDRQQRQGGVWPTLPTPQQQVAPQPHVDLSPTNQKIDEMRQSLDRLIGLLESKEAPAVPSEESVAPMISIPDASIGVAPPIPQADPAAQEALQKVAALADTAEKTAAAIEAEKEERAKLAAAVAEAGSLRERYEARLAKVQADLGDDASRREVIRAYVKDYVSEKLASGAGFSVGKVLAMCLGVGGLPALGIALGGWLVGRKIGAKAQSGEPLLAERLLDRVGLDELSDRIGDRLRKRFGGSVEQEA